MEFSPLIGIEMRRQVRQSTVWRHRLLSGSLAGILALLFFLVGYYRPGFASHDVFSLVLAILTLYGSFLSLVLVSDSLAGERRAGTLELVSLTSLGSFHLVLGKLASQGAGVLHTLLGFVPALALPVLFGGIGFDEIVRSVLGLVQGLFLALCAGVLFSAVFSNGRRALFSGLVLLSLLWTLPLLLAGMPEVLKLFSPITIHMASRPGTGSFALGLLCNHLLSWGLLGLSALLLRTERGRSPGTSRARGRHPWCPVLPGENPVFRLLCNARPRHAGLGLLLVCSGAVLICVPVLRGFGAGAIGLLILFSHVLLKLHVAWVAGYLAVRMKNSGMLELIMTTPLAWPLVHRGWFSGLVRRLLLPVLLLLAADVVLGLLPVFLTTVSIPFDQWIRIPPLAGGLLIDVWALAWIGLALGATSPSASRTWLLVTALVLGLPWLLSACILILLPIPFWFIVWVRFLMGLTLAVGVAAFAIDRLGVLHRESLAR